ncbi:MAG TPA: hypothetical protein VGO68_21260 [Pyrinomonadaceae bacterium]|jgi:hypothetical protein|nr:hypothetical protein [Pyrinomonadaceae bacterium]
MLPEFLVAFGDVGFNEADNALEIVQVATLAARHMRHMPVPECCSRFVARFLQPKLDDERMRLRLKYVNPLSC